MNVARTALAFLGSTVSYFVVGSLLFVALPAMKAEFAKYPGVFREPETMMKAMPYNMLASLVAIAVTVVLYAKMYPAGGGVVPGVYFGALIGVFAVCVHAVHNYALLNIRARLTMFEAVTYFLQWVAVGAAAGLIYKP